MVRLSPGGLALLVALLGAAACSNVVTRPGPRVAKRAPSRVSYTVTAPEGALRPRVQLCWEGGAPNALIANSEPAQGAVEAVEAAAPMQVRETDQGWALDEAPPAGCLTYQLDWGWTAFRHQDPDIAITFGDDVVAGADMLFLRPAPRQRSLVRRVRFQTGEVSVSAPYPPAADGWRDVPVTAFTRKGYVALGRFKPERIPVAGGMMELAVLDVGIDVEQGALSRWAFEAGRASAELHGALPSPFIQVLVGAPPLTTTSKPVLFGFATRGGGAGVNVVMSSSPDEERLVGEWVAVHELAHHGLPYLRRGQRWISEGMATYYQFILRARSGVLDDAQAWADLLQGARTAAAGSKSSYRWLYWGGAMGALRTDVELRVDTEGGWSLDKALKVFAERHVLDRLWTAHEVVGALDTIVGTDHFARWEAERDSGEEFARFEALFVELGVSAGPEGPADFDDRAPLAWARKAIEAPVTVR